MNTTPIKPKQTFTRKEVRELLKRQISACTESFNRLPVNKSILQGFDGFREGGYLDELFVIEKRLQNVNVIKF